MLIWFSDAIYLITWEFRIPEINKQYDMSDTDWTRFRTGRTQFYNKKKCSEKTTIKTFESADLTRVCSISANKLNFSFGLNVRKLHLSWCWWFSTSIYETVIALLSCKQYDTKEIQKTSIDSSNYFWYGAVLQHYRPFQHNPSHE